MKCNKCGQEINENDTFCGFCGDKIEKDNKKTNTRLFLIFTTELILLILVGIFFYSFYNENFNNKYASENEFMKYVNNNNYILTDSGRDPEDNENIVSYDIAANNEEILGIHYVVVDSNINADYFFDNVHYQMDSQVQSGIKGVVSLELINYKYYSLENNGNYYVLVKNENIVFAVFGLSSQKEEINKIVDDLGFKYPSNTFFIISAVIILVAILVFTVLWKIFVKAGVKGWKSLIPVYNLYCLSKIAFNKGWYFIFMLITPINLIFMPITFYKLAKSFGKSTTFAVLSIFFPYITMQIIAFDSSKYNQQKMTNNDNSEIPYDNKEIKEVDYETNVGKKAINAFKWFLTIVLLLLSAIILLAYLYEKLIGYLVLAIMFLIYGLMACPTVSECTKKYKTYTKFKTFIILLLIIINIVLFAVLPF